MKSEKKKYLKYKAVVCETIMHKVLHTHSKKMKEFHSSEKNLKFHLIKPHS